MRVFITDLEAYNNGHLVGAWYTLPMSEDELSEAIENELYKGRAICEDEHHHEEYFITDYECDYMDIGEYDDLYKLNDIAEKMESVTDEEKAAITLMMDNNIVSDLNEAIENIDNMICTGENTMEDVAYAYIEDTGMLGDMPESLQCYFDYEAFGRDLEINGSYFEDPEGVYWEYVA